MQRLLDERLQSGESFAELGARSGIPVSTLYAWSRKLPSKAVKPSSFVEMVTPADDPARPQHHGFEIAVQSDSLRCLVSVPPDFDSVDLRRLLKAVGESC